jgi:hypothetical protein
MAVVCQPAVPTPAAAWSGALGWHGTGPQLTQLTPLAADLPWLQALAALRRAVSQRAGGCAWLATRLAEVRAVTSGPGVLLFMSSRCDGR